MLTYFGAGAVTVMLLSYAFEHRSAWWVLVFALAWAPGQRFNRIYPYAQTDFASSLHLQIALLHDSAIINVE
jgi:hypothetical protein